MSERERATDIAFLAVKLNFISPKALYNEINIKFPFVRRHREAKKFSVDVYLWCEPTS